MLRTIREEIPRDSRSSESHKLEHGGCGPKKHNGHTCQLGSSRVGCGFSAQYEGMLPICCKNVLKQPGKIVFAHPKTTCARARKLFQTSEVIVTARTHSIPRKYFDDPFAGELWESCSEGAERGGMVEGRDVLTAARDRGEDLIP